MLFFISDKLIETKIAEFYQHQRSELLDISRKMQDFLPCVYWSSISQVSRQDHYIEVYKLDKQNATKQRIPLSTLHQQAPIALFKHIGSVEAQRDRIAEFAAYFSQHYHGRLLNPAQTILYGLEKRYLLELQSGGFPTIPTDIHPSTLTQTDINNQYPNPDKYIIKPLTGELSNSFALLSTINETWLRYKQALVGGWIIQPICDAVWNGEYQIIFLGRNVSHAIHKHYHMNTNQLPDQNQRDINPYTPTQQEITLGLRIKDFFNKQLQIPLQYFRFDFLKDHDGIHILEIEMVNPGFFYRYLPTQVQTTIQNRVANFFNHILEVV